MSEVSETKRKEYIFSHSKVYMREDGICVTDFTDNLLITEAMAAEVIDAIEVITEKKKVPHLLIFKPGNTVDKEAREYVSGERGLMYSKADAMVIHRISQKVVANFYMKINRPKKPTQFFSTADEALVWLKKFV